MHMFRYYFKRMQRKIIKSVTCIKWVFLEISKWECNWCGHIFTIVTGALSRSALEWYLLLKLSLRIYRASKEKSDIKEFNGSQIGATLLAVLGGLIFFLIYLLLIVVLFLGLLHLCSYSELNRVGILHIFIIISTNVCHDAFMLEGVRVYVNAQ